jgi:hypothetical protein
MKIKIKIKSEKIGVERKKDYRVVYICNHCEKFFADTREEITDHTRTHWTKT